MNAGNEWELSDNDVMPLQLSSCLSLNIENNGGHTKDVCKKLLETKMVAVKFQKKVVSPAELCFPHSLIRLTSTNAQTQTTLNYHSN